MSYTGHKRREADKKHLGRGVSPTAVCAEMFRYVVRCSCPVWGYGVGIQGAPLYPLPLSPGGTLLQRMGGVGFGVVVWCGHE